MKDTPLIVQSDRTLLLDVHHPQFEECRNDISTFCDLIKSPEHIHTYALTPISLWNAASCNIVSKTVIEKLEKWSKFPITDSIIFFIDDISSRFGKLVLCEDDREENVEKKLKEIKQKRTNEEIDAQLNEYLRIKAQNSKIKRELSKKKREGIELTKEEQELLDSLIINTTVKTDEDIKNEVKTSFEEVYLLKIYDSLIFKILENHRELNNFLFKVKDGVFALRKLDRGEIKVKLIELGYPVDDRIPLKKGIPIDVKLRDKTLEGKDFSIRDYQEQAASTLIGEAQDGSGYGTIVLPCGSGKTIIGIDILTKLSTRTLVITTNVASVHQWVNEIADKTTLSREEIGEYTGENKSAKKVTVCTYQVLTWRPDKIGP
ncbi:MAG: helicase-associated domain-containing protein, partial [Sphaerochaetaceae bacterium]|nr:helicase-associated domain-containing protein [Sphaerochaetaceae bacterium]